MAMSVDGLVSGLSTTDMVNQLMQVEALPQTALKNKVTAQNKAVTAYQDINTKLAALTKAAKALESDDPWTAVKASTSSDAAIVTTTSSASTGSLSFKVEQLATTHTLTYNQDPTKWVSSPTDAAQHVISGSTFDVVDTHGTPITLTPSDQSLQAVINKINATPDLVYKAAAVQIEPGKYTLQLTAVASGFGGRFVTTPTVDLGTPDVVTNGDNARIRVGVTNPYAIESATNTFTDVVSGVNVAVTKETGNDLVTVSMVADKVGLTDKIQAMVDAANAALQQIKTATAAKNGSTAAGALAGDPTLRALNQEILSAVATGAGSVGSLAAVGIAVERGGTLSFNKDTFNTAYTADPVKTRRYFNEYTQYTDGGGFGTPNVWEPGWDTAEGIARKLSAIGLKATEGVVLPNNPTATREGIVTGLIKRRNESIAALNDQVEAWDARLATRRSALQRQYSALEVALGKLKDQQSWLSGQLAGLS